jgi:hypothetical protein
MSRHSVPPIVVALAAALAACSGADQATQPTPSTATRAGVAGPSLDRAGYDQPGAHRQYGPAVEVGDGHARAYVVTDSKDGQSPLELGIALDERALDGLSPDMMQMFLLPLPQLAPEPYQVVELDWNPTGHPPMGIYDVPHFDFHFYFISLAERNAIVPSDPDYRAKANNVPTGDYVPPFYIPLTPPGAEPADLAVPQMGFHWSDVRSPELQGLFGHPENARPFTKTFIYGSWDGRFIFVEPMVARDYLLTHPDVDAEVPTPGLYPVSGYFPTSYRVTYDAQRKEYRVAITDFVYRAQS